MPQRLEITLGQHSDKGRKPANQDFYGACLPTGTQLGLKGVAVAIADGISSSSVSRQASEAAVKTFLEDYYCTPQAWSVKTSAQRVISAVNSWLYSQTRQSPYRYDTDRGFVCTLSALILKATTAHVFHVGDARVYRLRGEGLEQLTNDHRFWISEKQSYLGRALGADTDVEIDYRACDIEAGDIFFLATDGVYETIGAQLLADMLRRHRDDPANAATRIVEEAYARGSTDNLTAQVVRVDGVPARDVEAIHSHWRALPLPPPLHGRMQFDGYEVLRELHSSSRSHVYLALDAQSDTRVVIKTPSVDISSDPAHLERFAMEDWIAQRIDSPHVLKACLPERKRNYLYVVTEYIEGPTLTQWMADHPKPELETVRGIVEQVARGLQAFHRLEMLHQDLRPDNIMIDGKGTARIVDFGSTRVAGISELSAQEPSHHLLGTAQYAAPEYFLGEPGTNRSDIYSLGVIIYQMLSGRLPYGADVAKCRTRAAQRKLSYRPVIADDRAIPAWLDGVLRKATHPDPNRRYEELSELVYELRHPSAAHLDAARVPLLERNPAAFWRGVSLVLALIVFALLATR